MVLLVLAIVVGAVAGRVRSPLGSHAPRIEFRRAPLLAVGALGTLVAYLLPEASATVVMALSLAALLGFAGSNTHVRGVLVIGVGLLLNLSALVFNNGMPVRPSALVAAGLVERAELPSTSLRGPRHLETRADRFGVLGDVVPVAVPLAPEVVSFGDLIVVLGAADAMRDLTRRRHPTRLPLVEVG